MTKLNANDNVKHFSRNKRHETSDLFYLARKYRLWPGTKPRFLGSPTSILLTVPNYILHRVIVKHCFDVTGIRDAQAMQFATAWRTVTWSASTDILQMIQKLIWKMYSFVMFETDAVFKKKIYYHVALKMKNWCCN